MKEFWNVIQLIMNAAYVPERKSLRNMKQACPNRLKKSLGRLLSIWLIGQIRLLKKWQKRNEPKNGKEPKQEKSGVVTAAELMPCCFHTDDNIGRRNLKLLKDSENFFTALLVVGERDAVKHSLTVCVNDRCFVLVFSDVDSAIKHCDTPQKISYSKGYPLYFMLFGNFQECAADGRFLQLWREKGE